MRFYLKTALVLVVCVMVFEGAHAQTWRLPSDRKNTRHNSVDRFNIPRPALSIRGFDNTRNTPFTNTYSNTTYGVRQVLEKAYGIGTAKDLTVSTVLEHIINHSDDSFNAWTSDGNRDLNSYIFESQALIALLTFIIEQNDGGIGEPSIFTPTVKNVIPSMPSHSVALGRLTTTLRARHNFQTNKGYTQTWKNSTALMSVARAFDLYLALENAYEDLSGTQSNLLNASDKQFWNDQLHAGIKRIWQETNGDADWFTGLFDVQQHEVQQGNWPLMGFASVGYVVLGFNGAFAGFTDDDNSPVPQYPEDMLARAMKSTAFHYTQTGNNAFYNYWWYQTGAGKRFWGEGAYYFDITLERLIPFWHAIRANNFLSYGEGDGRDPFRYQPFLNPIEWLADIATPDGKTPPLDDGNKRAIESANILRWSSQYGSDATGSKFVWISNVRASNGQQGYGLIPSNRLIEIAMPRRATGAAAPALVGNDGAPFNKGEQQLVLRQVSGGDTHYVLLNGEQSEAIANGTGHEQPDNMQLLYYVGGTSFLMDSGYDNAEGLGNSTWNHYYDHNVLNFFFGTHEYYNGSLSSLNKNNIVGNPLEGGLWPPFPSVTRKSKVSPPYTILDLYYKQAANSKVTTLNATQRLDIEQSTDLNTMYWRNILFIDGAKPYLIDLNRLNTLFSNSKNDKHKFRMTYYSDSQTLSIPSAWNTDGGPFIKWSNVGGSGKNLYVHPMSIEFPLVQTDLAIVTDLVQESSLKWVKRLEIRDYAKRYNVGQASFINVLQVSTTDPSGGPRLIRPYSLSAIDPWQGWIWQQDTNTYDIFIARSSVAHTWQNVVFNLKDTTPSYPSFEFTLPSNQAFGFARITLNPSTEVWSVDTQYLLNLTPTTPFTYTTNTTISSTTFNKNVQVGKNVVLTITGPVTISSGVTVSMGSNAQIVTSGSGKITAVGTSSKPIRFVRSGTSAWKEITLNAGGNLFDYVVFDGGTKTVEVASTNNTFKNSRFKNGWRGISSYYVAGSSTTRSSFTLENCIVENNSTVGVVAYNSNPLIKRSTIQNNGEAGVYLYNASTSTFHRNVITGNGKTVVTRGGIEMYNASLSTGSDITPFNRAYNKIVNNAHHEFQLEGTSSLYLGYTTGLWGINTVYDTGTIASGEKLIYAATGTSVSAHNTYWKNQNTASNFQGVLATAYAYPISYDSSFVAGAGLSVPVAFRVAPEELTVEELNKSLFAGNTAGAIQQMAYDVAASIDMVDPALQSNDDLKQRMKEIRDLLAQNPTAPENVQWLRELFQLLRMDATDQFGERAANKSVFASFRNRLATLAQTSGLTPAERKALREAAETALLLEVQDAVWEERYGEANTLITAYARLVQKPDHVRTLLLNQVSLLEQQQRYSEALTLFTQFKAIQPEEATQPDYTPGNYDIIEETLREKAGVAGKGYDETAPGKAVDVQEVQAHLEEMPATYALEAAYPNPFNPVTQIPFALPEAARVTIEVYDVMGRRIATLVDRPFEAGRHQVSFDASRQASGVYLVRAQMVTKQGVHLFTQKVTLMK